MTGPLVAALAAGSHNLPDLVRRHLLPAVSHFSNIIAERAQGSYVWSTDGRRHLDMAGGIGVVSTGHCHPKVVAAMQEQTASFIHAQQNIYVASKPMVGLLDRLLEICPPDLGHFFFANSGSEAVDNAIKVARAHTKRQNIIAFQNGFHGRTFGAMSVTTSKTIYSQGFAPLVPGVKIAPYPYCLHCKTRLAHPEGTTWYTLEPNFNPDVYNSRVCCHDPHDALKWLLKLQTTPHETAAIIIEPLLGEGGFLTPPPDFFKMLRKICDEHGILLIVDEVQAGVGRTGRWWGHQHFQNSDPDIMIFAKGIASGFPFAGLAMKEKVMHGLAAGTMGGTYGASPVGCAAACATIDAIKEEGMIENADLRGAQLAEGLVRLSKKYPIIDVRGRGLMIAAELGGMDGSLTARHGTAVAVTKAAGHRNMLLITSGARETIRFLPPLNVSEAEVAEALSVFEGALGDVFHGEG